MTYDDRLIDKRVVDRNILKGLVEPNQLKRQIESLPDSEANCVHVSVENQGAEEDESYDDDEDEDDEDEAGPEAG